MIGVDGLIDSRRAWTYESGPGKRRLELLQERKPKKVALIAAPRSGGLSANECKDGGNVVPVIIDRRHADDAEKLAAGRLAASEDDDFSMPDLEESSSSGDEMQRATRSYNDDDSDSTADTDEERIRDVFEQAIWTNGQEIESTDESAGEPLCFAEVGPDNEAPRYPVSYTHLTLPTIGEV